MFACLAFSFFFFLESQKEGECKEHRKGMRERDKKEVNSPDQDNE